MTESLKSLLAQQAESVAFKPPDLDAIAHGNKRRIRRRRAVTALVGVAAAAVLAGTAVVLSGVADDRPDVAAPRVPGGVSWAVGSTIHDGADTIDVGHPVRAYVRTSVGFVTLDNANNVYSVTSIGVTRIGQARAVTEDGTASTRLYSDPSGSLAGWIGQDQTGLVLTVHDQATGRTRTFETAPTGLAFFAIDDRTAYWRVGTRNGVFAVNVDTGEERQIAAADIEIWSVGNAVLAFTRGYQLPGNLTSINVGRCKVPCSGFVAPVVWLDDSTVQVLAIGMEPGRDQPRGTLLTCTVPDGSCAVAADLPGIRGRGVEPRAADRLIRRGLAGEHDQA
jgi:hypothetical protein